ncbi:hypothetical protein ACLOJK_003741 [Asimina triloba]
MGPFGCNHLPSYGYLSNPVSLPLKHQAIMDFFFSILAALLFFFIFKHLLLQKKNKFNNLPPTPPSSLPILGHLHLLKKPLHRSLASLSAHYGPILYLRFGRRPVLVVSSSALADDCFSKSDIIFANRPRLLAGKHLGFDHTGIGSASYGPHWRNLRRLATVEILCSHRVQELSAIRAREVRSLLKALFRASEAGKSATELKSRFSELTFNAMMGMIADKRYYGEDVVDVEEAKRFRGLMKESSALSAVSNLGDFLPVLGWIDFGGVVKRMRRLARGRDEFLQGLINEKLRDKKKKNDEIWCVGDEGGGTKRKKKTLIEVLLSLQETEPDYYSDSVIKAMIAVVCPGSRMTC